jgi:hypothetical protein
VYLFWADGDDGDGDDGDDGDDDGVGDGGQKHSDK